MKSLLLSVAALACLGSSVGARVARAGDATDAFPGDAVLSFTAGNGVTELGEDMGWRAFELRVGKVLTPNLRVDLVHYNEGHATNSHRDGFALQGTCGLGLGSVFALEAGIGPYLSFDTTVRGGRQRDDKRVGFIATGAAVIRLEPIWPGLHLRVGVNHAVVSGKATSDALLLGLGMSFGDRSSEVDAVSEHPIQLSLMGGVQQTNRAGADTSFGGKVEVRAALGRHFGVSVSGILEGPDHLVHRFGVAAQLWAFLGLGEVWWVGAGVGPYVAWDLKDDEARTLGILSVELGRFVGDPRVGVTVFLRFSRIVTFDDTDRDTIDLGIGKRW